MKMSKITITAPGKSILHGEHAVVYGKGAIAVSLGLKSTLQIDTNNKDKIFLHFPSINIRDEWDLPKTIDIKFDSDESVILATEDYVKKTSKYFTSFEENCGELKQLGLSVFSYLYCAFAQKYNEGKPKSTSIEFSSDLPIGAGLGSSAAYSVCLSTALLCLYDQIDSKVQLTDKSTLELINKWAFQGERILHGNPSGIDNSICTYGGALFFQNGKIQEQLSKSPVLQVLLVYTKVARNTKKLVSGVREKYEKYPDIISPILDSMEAISVLQWKNLKESSNQGLTEKNIQTLNHLVPINQSLLNALGVGHPKLDNICKIAHKFGLSAKLTGAGGGGCAIIFKNEGTEGQEELVANLQKEGFDVWSTNLAGVGVQFQF